MGYKRTYETTSPTIASYDWADLTSGLGYRRFYLAGSRKATTTSEYFLTNEIVGSDKENASIGIQNSGTPQDIDFDVTFGVPAIIKGTAIFNFTSITPSASALDMTINVYHVSTANVETSLGQVILPQQSASQNFRRCAKIDLTSHAFAVGDKLRINIIATNTGANLISIYIDPSGRITATETTTGATITSSFTADIPFKIDI